MAEQFTRKDYMEGRMSHHAYYSAIAKECGISFKRSNMLPQIKEALAKGDEHLNSIPLTIWDSMAIRNTARISTVLKEHGDFYSLAGGVCVMKTAAIEAASKVETI